MQTAFVVAAYRAQQTLSLPDFTSQFLTSPNLTSLIAHPRRLPAGPPPPTVAYVVSRMQLQNVTRWNPVQKKIAETAFAMALSMNYPGPAISPRLVNITADTFSVRCVAAGVGGEIFSEFFSVTVCVMVGPLTSR